MLVYFFSCYTLCSHFCNVHRRFQPFIKAKIKLCTAEFSLLQRFLVSRPTSSCITWQSHKGLRLRDYNVESRCNQLRGHWMKMWSGPKCHRNVPMLGLNTERAINRLQVRFFLQKLPQILFLVVSPSILLMILTLISISGSYSHLCWEKSSQSLPSCHLKMQIHPKPLLLQYWPQKIMYSPNISAYF